MPKRKANRGQDGIYERADSPFYWASYTDGSGRRVRRSTRIALEGGERREAEALLAKWVHEAHQQRMWGKEPEEARQRYTFDEVMLAYLRGHGTRTPMKKRTSAVKPLYNHFSARDMDTITDIDIKQYIRERLGKVKAGTINKEISMLSAACNYCRDELGWEVNNPASRKKLSEPAGRVRWITGSEAEQLINAARNNPRAPWLADFIQLCLYTGLRRGEATSLTWDHVDFTRRLIMLDTGMTKSGRRRAVPLHPMALEALKCRWNWCLEHCPDASWVFCNKQGRRVQDMKKSFATARRDAGLSDFRQHDQRHTLASWMVMSGTELIKVRDMLGHSTVKMTERYSHLHPDALREAVNGLKPAQNGHAGKLISLDAVREKVKGKGNQGVIGAPIRIRT
ncbi:MAG: tyrosine-type recombinase/integrase [Pseudomonadota bacterium]